METKRIAVLVLFSVVLIIGFLFYFFVFEKQLNGKVILDETGNHGCLTHQGYTWNATERACVLEWVPANQSSRYQNYSSNISWINNSDETELNWTNVFNITEHEINSTNSSFGNSTSLGQAKSS